MGYLLMEIGQLQMAVKSKLPPLPIIQVVEEEKDNGIGLEMVILITVED